MAAEPIVVRITVDSSQVDGAVAKANASLGSFSTTAKVSASTLGVHSKSATEAAHAMEGFSFETVGAKRELLVLAHELSQGNFSRFGGSLLVLGERTGAASLLFSAMGLAVLGVTAVIGGFLALVAIGAHEQSEFNKSLQLTGNFAGVTASSFSAAAQNIAQSSGQSIGHSRELLAELVKTGRFGPEAIESVGKAAADVARLTGQTSEQTVQQFVGMTDGVAKWAGESNRQYHFLSVEQYAHISRLEEQGKAEQAMVLATQLLDNQLHLHRENLGTIERAWHLVTDSIGGAIEAIKSVGRETTNRDLIKDTLDQLMAEKKLLQLAQDRGLPSTATEWRQRKIEALTKAYGDLWDKEIGAQKAATAQADKGAQDQRGIEALKFLKSQSEQFDKRSAMQRELDKFNNAFADLDGTGQAYSEERKQSIRAGIRKKYQKAELSDAKALAEAHFALDREVALARAQVAQQAVAMQERANEQLYHTGQINLVEYYNRKAGFERQSLDAQQQALAEEIVALELEDKKLGKEADHIKNQAKQLDLARKIAELQGKSALVNGGQEAAAPIAFQLGRELRDSSAKVNAELILDDQVRAQTQLQIEVALQREKIDQQLKGSARYQEIVDQFDQYVVLRQARLTEQLKPEYQRQLELFQDLQRYMRQAQEEFMKGFIDNGRSAFEQWVTTGKLSSQQLVSFIQQQFAKLVYDKYLAGAVGNIGEFIWKAVTGSGGGSGGTGGGGSTFDAGTPLPDATYASAGMNVRASSISRFVAAPAAQSGRGNGDTFIFNHTFNGGVNRNELTNGLEMARRAAVSDVAEARRHGNRAFQD